MSQRNFDIESLTILLKKYCTFVKLQRFEEDENYFANEHQNPVIRNPSKI